MANELSTSFTDALNASGKAVEMILAFWLTVVITLLEGAARILRMLRTWITNGAKLPDWIFPRAVTTKERNNEKGHSNSLRQATETVR